MRPPRQVTDTSISPGLQISSHFVSQAGCLRACRPVVPGGACWAGRTWRAGWADAAARTVRTGRTRWTSQAGGRPASWPCIPRRRRSSTARMQIGAAIFRTSRLTPRLHIPGKENDLARAHRCAWLHARGESGLAQGHEPNNSALGGSSPQRQIPARPGCDVQSVHSRLGQLLRLLVTEAMRAYALKPW